MQNQFTITYVLSVVLWVGVISLVRRAWSGLMDEERERIDGFDLLMGALFLVAAFAVTAFSIVFHSDVLGSWVGPLVFFSVNGLALMAAKAVLGIPLTGRSNYNASALN